jgi:hypothetical protein
VIEPFRAPVSSAVRYSRQPGDGTRARPVVAPGIADDPSGWR